MFARLIRTVALLLFAGQAIIAQAHLHARAPFATASAAVAKTAPRQAPRDTPYDCPVCREIAHAGAYLTPGPIALAGPAPFLAFIAPAALEPLLLATPFAAWRSRAPPAPLP